MFNFTKKRKEVSINTLFSFFLSLFSFALNPAFGPHEGNDGFALSLLLCVLKRGRKETTVRVFVFLLFLQVTVYCGGGLFYSFPPPPPFVLLIVRRGWEISLLEDKLWCGDEISPRRSLPSSSSSFLSPLPSGLWPGRKPSKNGRRG